MNTPAKPKVVGIDVSKETLAVCYSLADKLQCQEVSNNKAGFKQLLQQCDSDSLYVMEATGAYYMQLAYYLHEQGAKIAVINPVVIKRFMELQQFTGGIF